MIVERFQSELKIVQQHFRGLGYFGVGCLKGPFDFLMLDYIRSILPRELLMGPAVPMCAFPLGLGSELQNESLTYIGGHCIHKSHVAWPRDNDSAFLPFIAQIDLRSLNDANCEAIQIFGSSIQGFDFRILTLDEIESPRTEEGEAISEFRLFGTKAIVIPSFSLTGLEDKLADLHLPDGRPVYGLENAITPLGLLVGHIPYIPAHALVSGVFEGLYVIACLPTICPNAGRPFEFVDVSRPMTEYEANSLVISIGEVQDDDSYGLIYVCRSYEGSAIVLRHVML